MPASPPMYATTSQPLAHTSVAGKKVSDIIHSMSEVQPHSNADPLPEAAAARARVRPAAFLGTHGKRRKFPTRARPRSLPHRSARQVMEYVGKALEAVSFLDSILGPLEVGIGAWVPHLQPLVCGTLCALFCMASQSAGLPRSLDISLCRSAYRPALGVTRLGPSNPPPPRTD